VRGARAAAPPPAARGGARRSAVRSCPSRQAPSTQCARDGPKWPGPPRARTQPRTHARTHAHLAQFAPVAPLRFLLSLLPPSLALTYALRRSFIARRLVALSAQRRMAAVAAAGESPVSSLYHLLDGSRMAAAGGLAGVIARTATAPLDRVKLLFQVQAMASSGTSATAYRGLVQSFVKARSSGPAGAPSPPLSARADLQGGGAARVLEGERHERDSSRSLRRRPALLQRLLQTAAGRCGAARARARGRSRAARRRAGEAVAERAADVRSAGGHDGHRSDAPAGHGPAAPRTAEVGAPSVAPRAAGGG